MIVKRRYIYALLVGVPGFAVSLVIAVVVFGMIAGILWIVVFGDNPWPSFVETLLPVSFAVTFLVVWISTVSAGYFIGTKREQDAALNKGHVLLSTGITVLFVFVILLYEWGIGNIGAR